MRRRIFLLIFFLLFVFFLYAFILPRRMIVKKEIEPEFGFSFSPRHAVYLGLDWQETYLALLDGLEPRSVRIPVYWHETEKERGQYDFKVAEWQVKEAAKRGIPIVLVIGYRSFHRPECYPPSWVKVLNQEEFEKATLVFIEAGVKHFSRYDNIEVWQVENEPLDILRSWRRRLSPAFVAKEIEAVKVNDPKGRPVLLTFGGEIFFRPLWRSLAPKVDIIGVSFYPKVWSKFLQRYIETYKLGIFGPRNIAIERGEMMRLGKQFWIVEFQAEPWGPRPLALLEPEQVEETMSPAYLEEYLDIVKKAGGVERIYFWGVEWWYKELLEGRGEMWELGKSLMGRGKG